MDSFPQDVDSFPQVFHRLILNIGGFPQFDNLKNRENTMCEFAAPLNFLNVS
jgi:hypothetical protein